MDTRIPFVLDDESLKASWLAWRPRIDALLASGVPLCMAEGDEGGDGAGDAGAGDSSGTGDDAAKGGVATAEEDTDDSDEDTDDHDDGELAKAQAEKVALQRRLGEAEKARKRAERDLRKATEEKRQEQGEYEQMYKDEKARADELETKLKNGALNRTIIDAATELNFRNPAIVPSLVKVKDAVDEDGEVDETLVKNAVQALAKRETYLVREDQKPQGTVRGEKRPGSQNGTPPADVQPGYDRIRYGYEKPVKQRT